MTPSPTVGSDQETNRAILIRLNDPAEIARRDGTTAAIAQTLAPATVEARVFDDLAVKLRDSLKGYHVDADVSVVEPTSWTTASTSKHLWQDIAIGIGAVGVAALVWRFISGVGR